MSDQDSRRLAKAVAIIRDRFGTGALYRLGEVTSAEDPAATNAFMPPRLPTGFATLDEALGGGLPRGRLAEIGGAPTTGVVTLALKIVASAQTVSLQTQRNLALYLDPGQTFDPAYADRCGVRLDRLLLLHPLNRSQALALLRDLVLNRAGGVLVFDLPAPATGEEAGALSVTLDRLLVPLARSNIILLCLNIRSRAQAAPQAAVRLWLERERWLYHQHDIHGYQAQVEVLKNKGGPAGQQVPVAFTWAGLPRMR